MRRGLVALAVVVIVGFFGYRLFGYSWSEALWLLTITLSTVGYAERPTQGTVFQLFTIGIIIVGLVTAGYTFGGLIQMMIEGELSKSIGQQRQLQYLKKLKDHIVICGYGRIGQVLAEDLAKHRCEFVVIEQAEKPLAEAKAKQRFVCLEGDATEESVLLAAGVQRARAIITALPADTANVFITLTARALNPDIFIIARAEYPTTERKLRTAGADRVVMPALIGAHIMERLVTRPHTADFLELLAESSFADVEMDEIVLAPGNALIGKTLASVALFRQLNVLVVAIKMPDDRMIFNPDPSHVFEAGHVLLVTGHIENIHRLRSEILGTRAAPPGSA